MDEAQGEWRQAQTGRGRNATAPHHIPASGWKDVLWRTYAQISSDRVLLIAAGVTFYMLLSMVPALTAFVSLYGLFADPAMVSEQVSLLAQVVPSSGMEIINDQLSRLIAQGRSTLGWALALSVGLALWSASAGVRAMFDAMNVAFGEKEERNFFFVILLSLVFTLCGLVAAILMVSIVLLMPLVFGFLGLDSGIEGLVQGVGYLLLVGLLFVGVAALYRFGPSRGQAKWRWITPGAVLSVVIILIVSLLYSWYAANFADFDKTYGSLGALIGFLMWIWISCAIVIIGAELDAETEHQTARDSTTGAELPMGERQAVMADTIGKAASEGGDPKEDPSSRSPEWRDGYEAARREAREGRRQPLSLGTLALTVPAALVLAFLQRRRGQSRQHEH